MVSHSYVSKRIKSQKSYQRALHFHDAFELFFSLNDGSKFFLADRIYDIHRGVVVLIPEGTLHRKVNPDNLLVDSYAIHFPSAFLKENSTPKTDLYAAFGENLSCFQLPEEEINLIKPLFDRCMKPPGENFGGDICRNIHLIELLLTIYPFIPTVSTIHARKNAALSDLLIVVVLAIGCCMSTGGLGDTILKFAFMSMGLRGAVVFLPLCFSLWLPGKVSTKYALCSVIVAPILVFLFGTIFSGIVPVDSLFIGVAASALIMFCGLVKSRRRHI